VAKKSNVENDSDVFDDIEVSANCEVIENIKAQKIIQKHVVALKKYWKTKP